MFRFRCTAEQLGLKIAEVAMVAAIERALMESMDARDLLHMRRQHDVLGQGREIRPGCKQRLGLRLFS